MRLNQIIFLLLFQSFCDTKSQVSGGDSSQNLILDSERPRYLDSRPLEPPRPALNLRFREFSHLCTQASKLKSRPKMSEIMIENKLSSMLLSDLVIA